MADCCLIKKVATVEVYENKNEVRAYGFMAGDRNTPVIEVRFKHLWGESNLSNCKLRWIIVDDVGSLLVGEVPIQHDNTALINLPNELFTGDRRMKVQLTLASCDGERILNLQQFTDLKVINSLAPNEVVEPVYQILINAIYDESQKYLKELEASYTQKYGSLDSLYRSARASLEEYLITAENGGNAEFLQGYSPAHFQKVENTINDLIASKKYKVGDVVEVLGYYDKGDGAQHLRKKMPEGYSGTDAVIGVDESIWGIVHNSEVNVSWFGAKGDGITDDSSAIQKAIDFSNYVKFMKKHKIDTSIEINSNVVMLSDNTEIIATKLDKGIFKILEGCKFIQAKGFVFDANMQNFPTYSQIEYDSNKYYSIFWFNRFNGVLDISQNIFKNLYNHYIYFYECAPNGKISNNKMSSPLQSQGLRADYIGSVTCNGYYELDITGNYCDNEIYTNPEFGICFAMFAHCCGKTTIKNNIFNCFGRNNTHSHRLLTIDLYTDCTNFTIENNTFLRNTWGAIRIEESESVYVANNKFETLYNLSEIIAEPFIAMYSGSRRALRDVKISDNNFLINGNLGIIDAILVYGTTQTSNISISKNSFSGKMRYAVNAEDVEISDMNIIENIFNSNSALNIKTGNFKASNIKISLNSFKETTSKNPIHLEFDNSNDIFVYDNNFRWIPEVKANVSIRIIGAKGVNVKGNYCVNFGGFIDAINNADIMVYNNNIFANYNTYKDNSSSAIIINNILNGGLVQLLDTPYYATKMQERGIYADYANYRDELHEYENSKNTNNGIMALIAIQEPTIPKSVEEFAKEYNLI